MEGEEVNEVHVAFSGDRFLRMEKHSDHYRIGWFKPDENNGAVKHGSHVVLSDEAMRATIAAYLELNKEPQE